MYEYNRLKYRGYYFDEETGFYYLNSRFFDPVIGRFINADDVSYLGVDDSALSYNLYTYCKNNPVLYVDSDGNLGIFSASFCIIAASTIIGGLLGAFNAATTGGNVAVGALQGGANGLFCSIAGLYAPTPIKGVVIASMFTGILDYTIQSDLYDANMGEKPNICQSVKVACENGAGASIPVIGNAADDVVDAITTGLIWNEASALVTCADVVVTNATNAKSSGTNSRMTGWSSEQAKIDFYNSRTVIGK